VAEVTIKNNRIHVNRIVTALDCGQAVNPNGVKAQIEGGTLFGLSAALKEAITVKDGAIQQQNFDSYDLLRMPDAPHLETYILPSDRPPGGIGEAGVPPVAASVANAVFCCHRQTVEEAAIPAGSRAALQPRKLAVNLRYCFVSRGWVLFS
jgi:isoquinoline 1-oxidoreductase beta subunit